MSLPNFSEADLKKFRYVLCLLFLSAISCVSLVPPTQAVFQPSSPTLEPTTPLLASATVGAAETTATQTQQPTPSASAIPLLFADLNFENISLPISIQITTGEEEFVIETNPVLIESGIDFTGLFEVGMARIIREPQNVDDIVYGVHSGRDSLGRFYPAEGLRVYLEDVSVVEIWQRLPEKETIQRIKYLINNAKVTIFQGDQAVEGLRVLDIVRIPPNLVADFSQNVDSAVKVAAEFDQGLIRYLDNPDQHFFLVFCGWKKLGESAPAGTKWYFWSRYLVVIGQAP